MMAVKVVFLKEDELRETLLEMEIIKACAHPNITRYMGCFLKGLDLWVSSRAKGSCCSEVIEYLDLYGTVHRGCSGFGLPRN
jgi:hypothetical protein